jgi:hypothetical protein
MKKLVTVVAFLVSLNSFAGISCSGGGVDITISDSPLQAEIRYNGSLIARTTDVSDISAFEIHYIGNFGRSSFDLVVSDNNKAKLSFDNYALSAVRMNCH